MGLLVTLRLNLLSVVLLRLVVSMGPGRVDAALCHLGLPEKLRILLLLTARGIFLLSDRMMAMLRAVRLRAPDLRGFLKWRVFACVLASSLLQSADRSERMMLAVRCRGGLAGFAQARTGRWRGRDTGLCLLFALNIAGLLGNAAY